MKPAQPRSSAQTGKSNKTSWQWLPRLCLLVCLGCASNRAGVERSLKVDRYPSPNGEDMSAHYRLACPDVLEIRVSARPQFDADYIIGPDGCIDLGDYGALRVEGQTPLQAARKIAEELGVPPDQIRARVAQFKSRRLFLFGEVFGWQRSIPYQGPETVLDVLHRVGGITRGAEPKDVHVVRPHLDDGRRPEAFHVDLRAIVDRGDQSTNVRVEPFDQIFVGESSRSRFENTLPRWMQPWYRKMSNPSTGDRTLQGLQQEKGPAGPFLASR